MAVLAFLDHDAGHAEPGHPERPARLGAVRAAIEGDERLTGLARVEGGAAAREALERVHTAALLDRVEALAEGGGGVLDADTYVTPASWDVARRACGGLLAVVDAVLAGGAAGGFAVGRPPGHHAAPDQAMGFCLVNHVAVAARHAQAAHGAERVLVVDLDAHHGNGTQDAFYDDPSVLVVSSHQAGLYPSTGALDEAGGGAGAGATVNLPLPARTGDALVDLYRAVLPPLAARFRPDLVVVSAGFDAHRLDPLGGLSLSVTGLVDLVGVVQEAADAQGAGLALSLEGGYNTGVLAACVAGTLRRLLDPTAPVDDPFGPSRCPAPDLTTLAQHVRDLHGL
ncbi:histone deacetylase family protein [Rubrivirga litoralis]|uniref:Histone deacetylase n=1 Tax=Rubrivirga litoralis TaxID=3075598 RepID=A0ABU3BMW8_9BACT|nr:histone deacetylase [Rubrivirga sp. F394]MDT0630634.1 histone deacetylase [Rubrivirga sp. F394]